MSERTIKVSIIVPCYNVEKFLPKCLDSLVNQTLTDIEIICVNDASPDNSIAILRRYERDYPGKVFVVDLPENIRLGGARNEGIKPSKGEYISFVDSDDWVALDMFETLYAVASDKDADIVSCNLLGTKIRDLTITPACSGSGAVTGGELRDFDRERNMLRDGSTAVGGIFRRQLIIDNDMMFVPKLLFEDMVWKPLLLLYAKNMYHVNRAMYYVYENNDSITRKKNVDHYYDMLKIYPILITDAKKRGFYQRFKDAIDYRFMNIYYMDTFYFFLNRMSDVNLDKLYEMRLYVIKNLADYRDNPFFRPELRLIKGYRRVLLTLMDTDPELAFEYMKTLYF